MRPVEPRFAPTVRLAGAALAGLLVGSLLVRPAHADGSSTSDGPTTQTESASQGELQEVTVTATRRVERLQDVPISISAISQDELDAEGLRTIDDLTAVTPGVTFQRMGTSLSANYNDENSDINIRGIDSQAGTSTTGIYIDDTPIETRHVAFGTVNPFPALFDLDRVEVLRGPQGTLFGASTEGGAVRFISPDPGLDGYSGYVRDELSTTDYGDTSYNLGVAGGGPLIDGVLGFRASVSFERDGGWVDRVDYSHPGTDPLTPPTFDRVTDADANWQQTATARFALKWVPTENLTVTPSFYFQRLYINDTAAYWVSLSDPAAGIFRNGNALTNPSTDPFWLGALKLNWTLGGVVQLTANTSYFSRDQHSVSDYTQYDRATFLGNSYPQPGDAGSAPFADTQHNFYQEVRFTSLDAASRLQWTAGLFYEHLDENVSENIYDPTLNSEFTAEVGIPLCGATGILGAPCPNGTYLIAPLDRTIDRQIAAYGELSFKLTRTITATAGVRVSKDDVEGSSMVTGGAFALNPGQLQMASVSERPVTPKFVLSWQPSGDSMYYLNASKGYRVGGTNGQLSSICAGDLAAIGIPVGPDGSRQAPEQYSSDSLWSYELGSKLFLLDHRLQIDASVYWIDWKDIQQNVYLPDCGQQYVANLGEVRSRGGDIDIRYRPIDLVTLGLTASYTDAAFTETACATSNLTYNGTACVGPAVGGVVPSAKPIVTDGDQLLGAPWNIHLSTELTHNVPVAGGRLGYLRLDYQITTAQTGLLAFQDSRNALFDNTIPGLPLHKELGARAGLRFNGFDLSLFGENLTNSHPLMFESRDIPPILPTSAPDNTYYARSIRPRTIGVTGTYRF